MPPTWPDGTIVVYSDFVCPFCYLGKESLRQATGEDEDAPPLEWRPFDLRHHQRREDGTLDDAVPSGKSEAYYERARRNVERLAEELDVEMVTELTDVDSWPAHRAALRVEQEAGVDALGRFAEAAMDALWRDGRDIGDPEVLVDVARAAEVDPDLVREAAGDASLDAELRERLEEPRELGVQAVPTFVYEGRAVQGAAPPERFRALLEARQDA